MSILKDKFEAVNEVVFSPDNGYEMEFEIKRPLAYFTKPELEALIQELTELKDKMI